MRLHTEEQKRRASERAAKWNKEHPERFKAHVKKYLATHPDRRHASEKRSRLKARYGITDEQKELLLARQGFVCAICGTAAPPKQGWHTDHDHSTGQVRGILCQHCNVGIGYLKDDPAILANAISYLQNPPANAVLH